MDRAISLDLIRRLAQAEIIFYILPLLMIVLIAGTLAQVDMGLYAAHKTYFSSWLFWIGPVPLPGGMPLMWLLTLSLLIKFIFFSEWRRRKTGIILSHLGVLVLMLGGLITAMTASEGFMVIPEGDQTPYIYDYTKRELFIFKDDTLISRTNFNDLENTDFSVLPFTLKIGNQYKNIEIKKREQSGPIGGHEPRGMAQHMALHSRPEEKEEEANIVGLALTISGVSDEQDGYYLAFEAMPGPIELKRPEADYRIIFGKAQRLLPFSIRLEKFSKDTHPGMTMARRYTSDITILYGDLQWPARITMNAPLRYKGYTFYQSAYEEWPDHTVTILTVVENKGQFFPYIGAILIAFGLALHSLIKIRESRQR